MDNLFEYLLYAFIIISFISSFFKKKKIVKKETLEQQFQQQPGMKENIIKVPPSNTHKAEDYDILSEIEGFFNVGEPVKKKTEVHSDKDMYKGAEDRENFMPVPEKSFHATTESEHTFTDPWEIKRKELEKRKKKLSPEFEKQASAYEESLIRKDSAATGIIKDIKKRLKSPSTLKEYVIISEIIGKPKALKR